jgi:bifunctional UDP-N-acetylglucosamine pyrophosphorylase/glucosamine-1-phosphate N-acetyltransferase
MTAVILAAGKSKRMGLSTPKVLMPVAGRPLLGYVIRAARDAGLDRVIVVVGTAREQVESAFAGSGVEYAVQREQRGTADALLSCRELLKDEEHCVVLCGDTPLLSGKTIRRLEDVRRSAGADIAVLTARLDDPAGYGRIVRGPGDVVEQIVEQRDATEEQRRIDEINSGVYAFRWGHLRPVLEAIEPSPVSGEYYLTDAIRAVRSDGGTVVAVLADDPAEIHGVNTPEQFERVAEELGRREAFGTE